MTLVAATWTLGIALLVAPLAAPRGAVRPFPGEGWGYAVTQAFGAERARGERYHAGVDIAAPCGTDVRAPGAGTIVAATRGGEDGAWLVVRLGPAEGPAADALFVRYDHLMTLARGPGPVAAGDVLGRSGRSGRAAGCHLHLSVRLGAAPEQGYTRDPPATLEYLDPATVFAPTVGPARR